jgi:hypothetical protein
VEEGLVGERLQCDDRRDKENYNKPTEEKQQNLLELKPDMRSKRRNLTYSA